MLLDVTNYPFLIRILNNLLNDKDKIKIISLNKYLNNKRTKFTYDKQIKIKDNDQYEWYYDCLTNIFVNEIFRFPKSLKSLTFGNHFNKSIGNIIPNSVTNLIFGWKFNQNVYECIPNSVTHLTFGFEFNKNIEGCIPNSVTNLRFGYTFYDNDVRDKNTIFHITTGDLFIKELKNLINVTSLTICIHPFEKIQFPSSLKQLCANGRIINMNKDNIYSDVNVEIYEMI